MKTLREYIKEAEEKKVAIGHFNISNLEGLHGVYEAAKSVSVLVGEKVPVIIGLSEGEEDFVGSEEAVVLVKEIRERDDYPIFLNADHHYSFERTKQSINAGFDAVIIDGAKLSLEENVAVTKECVGYVKTLRDATDRDVLVEAEIGYIGSGSNIKDSIPEGAGTLTDPEDAKNFVQMTDIDLLAPSVGSIHGIVKGGEPHIDGILVKKIRESAGVPLVLHGGSGLRDEDFTSAISSGISVIHISTEIRLAYKEALEKFLKENPNEITTYKILAPAVEAVKKVAEARLKLFNNL